MIMGYLDSRDMSSALQTCHAMRNIFEPCLYARIIFPSSYRRQNAELFRTLHGRLDLAHNIVTFEGSLYPTPRKSRFRHWIQSERAFSKRIVISIHHMVNVRSLSLRDFRWVGTPAQTRICDAICSTGTFTSLTTLIIQDYDFYQYGRHPADKFQLCLILRHLPLLERLELWTSFWEIEQRILPTDIPRLTHLIARPREAKVIVPGRPITSLSIKYILMVPGRDFMEALSMSTGSIHTLKVETMDLQHLLSFLRLLSVHVQDVQKLILDGPRYEHLPMLTQEFPSFRSLRTVCVRIFDYLECTLHGVGVESWREENRADLSADIRLKCPQFERLDYGLFRRCNCGTV
ncbi:hypothetical protein FRB93_001944 [Tulasnella sp. JGI-2019a]|nr:hypothetical protein FRB93_001944 [Tulasnella sp. JGI-2019a]